MSDEGIELDAPRSNSPSLRFASMGPHRVTVTAGKVDMMPGFPEGNGNVMAWRLSDHETRLAAQEQRWERHDEQLQVLQQTVDTILRAARFIKWAAGFIAVVVGTGQGPDAVTKIVKMIVGG